MMTAVQPTPYPELNEVIAELRNGIEATLGRNLAGLYLQGSFALGDYDEHSDVDFIAVTEQELTSEEAEAIQKMHARIFELPSEWAKHLEGSYFSRKQILEPPGRPVWYLDHGHTTLQRSDHCNTLVVRWTLYKHGIVLHGPEVRSLLNPTEPNALRDEVRNTMIEWRKQILEQPEKFANRFYQGLIVLSYCRMLHTIESGEVHSKKASAEWAKNNLPSAWHALIDRTWATRPNVAKSFRTPADEEDFRKTLALVRFAMQRVEGLNGYDSQVGGGSISSKGGYPRA